MISLLLGLHISHKNSHRNARVSQSTEISMIYTYLENINDHATSCPLLLHLRDRIRENVSLLCTYPALVRWNYSPPFPEILVTSCIKSHVILQNGFNICYPVRRTDIAQKNSAFLTTSRWYSTIPIVQNVSSIRNQQMHMNISRYLHHVTDSSLESY
jgi:hypothetical protein